MFSAVRPHRQRYPLDDVQPVAVQAHPLGRVVGQQPHRPDTQVDQNLRADAVVAGVGRQAEFQVRVDGVVAGVLQLIGLQLVHQTDAAALVPAHVEHHAAAFAGHHRHRGVQLRTAVAAPGAEHVTGQAFRVHPDQHVVAVTGRAGDVAADQRDVLDVLVDARVADRPELAVPGRDAGLGDALDVLLDACGATRSGRRSRSAPGRDRRRRHAAHRCAPWRLRPSG